MRLNSCNTCYHSVQNLSSLRPLSTNVGIRIYKTIILPVRLYGCETLSLTLREEHRLKVKFNHLATSRNHFSLMLRSLYSTTLHVSAYMQAIIKCFNTKLQVMD
jgi:hypothetical protein